jgi:uncharacterized membrane protein YqaE (UPF0057 family)
MRTSRGLSPFSRWQLDSLHWMAVLLPPVAVLQSGHPERVPLSVVLTLLLWVPGVVHAWHVVGRAAWEREQQFVAAFQHHVRH